MEIESLPLKASLKPSRVSKTVMQPTSLSLSKANYSTHISWFSCEGTSNWRLLLGAWYPYFYFTNPYHPTPGKCRKKRVCITGDGWINFSKIFLTSKQNKFPLASSVREFPLSLRHGSLQDDRLQIQYLQRTRWAGPRADRYEKWRWHG